MEDHHPPQRRAAQPTPVAPPLAPTIAFLRVRESPLQGIAAAPSATWSQRESYRRHRWPLPPYCHAACRRGRPRYHSERRPRGQVRRAKPEANVATHRCARTGRAHTRYKYNLMYGTSITLYKQHWGELAQRLRRRYAALPPRRRASPLRRVDAAASIGSSREVATRPLRDRLEPRGARRREGHACIPA